MSSFSFSLRGWEDGQRYEKKNIQSLDRWELQECEEITIHFHANDSDITATSKHLNRGSDDITGTSKQPPSRLGSMTVLQDPHSPHLGGYIWTSGVIMSFLVERWFSCQGDRAPKSKEKRRKAITRRPASTVLELGAGVAMLPSMAWSRMGARHVFASDILELIPAMERNIRRNEATGQVHALPLLWTEDISADRLPSELPASLDVITMCDCIYSEANAKALVMTLLALCKRNPNRRHCPIHCMSEVRNQAAQDEFVRAAKKYFNVDLVPLDVWHAHVPKECRMDFINLYTLRYLDHGQGKQQLEEGEAVEGEKKAEEEEQEVHR